MRMTTVSACTAVRWTSTLPPVTAVLVLAATRYDQNVARWKHLREGEGKEKTVVVVVTSVVHGFTFFETQNYAPLGNFEYCGGRQEYDCLKVGSKWLRKCDREKKCCGCCCFFVGEEGVTTTKWWKIKTMNTAEYVSLVPESKPLTSFTNCVQNQKCCSWMKRLTRLLGISQQSFLAQLWNLPSPKCQATGVCVRMYTCKTFRQESEQTPVQLHGFSVKKIIIQRSMVAHGYHALVHKTQWLTLPYGVGPWFATVSCLSAVLVA